MFWYDCLFVSDLFFIIIFFILNFGKGAMSQFWLKTDCFFIGNSLSIVVGICWDDPYLGCSFSFLSDSSSTTLWSYLQKAVHLKQSNGTMQSIRKVVQLSPTLFHLGEHCTCVKSTSVIVIANIVTCYLYWSWEMKDRYNWEVYGWLCQSEMVPARTQWWFLQWCGCP